jgi:hypothetical protein
MPTESASHRSGGRAGHLGTFRGHPGDLAIRQIRSPAGIPGLGAACSRGPRASVGRGGECAGGAGFRACGGGGDRFCASEGRHWGRRGRGWSQSAGGGTEGRVRPWREGRRAPAAGRCCPIKAGSRPFPRPRPRSARYRSPGFTSVSAVNPDRLFTAPLVRPQTCTEGHPNSAITFARRRQVPLSGSAGECRACLKRIAWSASVAVGEGRESGSVICPSWFGAADKPTV